MKRFRGHSLLEVTVAMALTGLLMLCAQQLLAAAARYYRHSQASIELQQSLLAACSRVSVEVGESNYGSIVVDAGPPAGIVFITPRRFDGKTSIVNGKAQWFRMVAFYSEIINGEPCLIWKERMVPTTTVPPYPAVGAPWDKISTWQGFGQKPKIVARRITNFTVTDTTPLLVQMTASDPSGRYEFIVESRIHPKN